MRMASTFVVLGERVRVDDVEATHAEQLLAINKVLPLALQYPDIRLVEPTKLTHVCEDVWVRLDDDVQ